MSAPIYPEDWIRSDGNGGVIIGDADAMPAEHLPQLIAWIYEAAGKPNPIILPLPPLAALGGTGPGWHVNLDGRSITVRAVRLPPAEARTIAAVIAATAHLADKERDLAEADRLATVLNAEMDTDPETLARRLLANFEVKERT